jgi:6,7-dimethyl-8-ribityllumazine synthase
MPAAGHRSTTRERAIDRRPARALSSDKLEMTNTIVQHALPLRRIAFVQSSWHKALVDRCRQGFEEQARELAGSAVRVDYFEVPGAFELPLHAKRLANARRYDAVVCAGLVVDGGIYRHDFVAQAVISGLMQVQLETQVPVISVVLTPHHFHEHAQHQSYFRDHLLVKGQEAAQAALSTLAALDRIDHPLTAVA